jgi:hypothetical protein
MQKEEHFMLSSYGIIPCVCSPLMYFLLSRNIFNQRKSALMIRVRLATTNWPQFLRPSNLASLNDTISLHNTDCESIHACAFSGRTVS